VTLGELHAGALAAADTEARARRWAELRVRLPEQGRRAKIKDLWIAAVAKANGMDVVTADGDFDVIEQAGGPQLIRV
jgi:predicted nucleic acid-binding protein